jgi:thiamine biosynthesis lipoprotein
VIAMPMTSTLSVSDVSAEWPIWSTLARVVVTDPRALAPARALVVAGLDAIERACSRFHPSELRDRVNTSAGRPVTISPLLAALVSAALEAAAMSDGDVTPALGGALARAGYDRDFHDIAPNMATSRPAVQRIPDWTDIRLRGRTVQIPRGVELDLGATAKAHAADWCARMAAQRFGVGVLVSLGGDIATAGAGPAGGWSVLVADHADDPIATIALRGGGALATSSTTSRTWRSGDRLLHHILDPRTCRPADPIWRTVSVAAGTCLKANTLSTAAIVRGRAALPWLRASGMPARLIDADHHITTLNGWPS